MLHLPNTLRTWNSPSFAATLVSELADQRDMLPLLALATGSSAVSDEAITVMLLQAWEDVAHRYVKVGIFFSGIVAGCNCADDPTPVEARPEYGELRLRIDPVSAATTITPL